MNDISFMFDEINTILPETNFKGFDTGNITRMSYMFYNCDSLLELPDISNF